jgi:hypothetical protein
MSTLIKARRINDGCIESMQQAKKIDIMSTEDNSSIWSRGCGDVLVSPLRLREDQKVGSEEATEGPDKKREQC